MVKRTIPAKLILTIIATLAIVTLPFLAGCVGDKEETTTTISVAQLQNKITTLESKVSGLEIAIANISPSTAQLNTINSKIATIENNITSLQAGLAQVPGATDLSSVNADIADIRTDISSLANEAISLKSQVDGFTVDTSSFDADIEAIRVSLVAVGIDLADLQDQIDDIDTGGTDYSVAIVTLQTNLGLLTTRVATLEINLLSTAGYVSILETRLDSLTTRVTTLETLWTGYSNTPRASITEFGSTYLKIVPQKTGDYVIIVTLYGTVPNTPVAFPLGIASAVETDRYSYGSGTVLIIMLKPVPISLTVPGVWSTATANAIVLTYPSGINYATITTGVR